MLLWLAPLCTALLIYFSSAPIHQGYLALLAFIPLLFAQERSWKHRLLLGWLAGFLTQAVAYYWIFLTVRDFGGLSAPLSALSAVLFWAAQGLDMGLWLLLFPLLAPKDSLIPRPLMAAACWYLLQAHLFPYVFPWVYGASFIEPAPLGAGAALWTDHGLGFLAIWMQVGLFCGITEKRDKRYYAAACLLPLALFLGGGLGRTPAEEQVWRVAVVQPNIIPWAKRNKDTAQDVFMTHYEKSMQFVRQDVDLIIWPETAVPFKLNGTTYYENKLRELAVASDAAVITGAVEYNNKSYYNAIFLYAPNVDAPQIYRKAKLVAFSENLPWFLRWALKFVPQLGGFSAGEHNKPFDYRGLKIIPLVCYEAMFSDYVNSFQGNLMVNVTNDAWFGKTKASAEHLQQTRMRTLEKQIPMVRATNSGISCWVDIQGQIHDASPVYEEAYPIYEIPIPMQISDERSRWGARIIATSAVLLFLWGLASTLKRRNKA